MTKSNRETIKEIEKKLTQLDREITNTERERKSYMKGDVFVFGDKIHLNFNKRLDVLRVEYNNQNKKLDGIFEVC